MAALQTTDTLLYEVKQACLQMSLPVPTGIYDSADENAQLMGSAVNLAGIMIAEAYDWQQLRKDWTLTGDGTTKDWDLPPNFSRFVDETGWSTATGGPVVVLTPQQWAAALGSFHVNPACRIMADQLRFLSAPAAGEVITFEYIDKNWVIDAADPFVRKSRCDANADMPMFDWLLMTLAIKVKWLEQKGMSTLAAQGDFNDRLLQLTQRDKMAQTLTLSGPAPGGFRYLNGANVADSGYG